MYVRLSSLVENGESGIEPERPLSVEEASVLAVENWGTQRLVVFQSALGLDLEPVSKKQCKRQGPFPVPSASTNDHCWSHWRCATSGFGKSLTAAGHT